MPDGYISYRAFNYITLPWLLHRPNVECQKIGANYYLVAEEGYTEYRWSTGAATSSIKITNTGEYWVFVPYGTGYISSEHIYITDTTNPCLYTDVPPRIIRTELSLKCMPNPTTDQIRIIYGLPTNTNITISLLNLLGTEIRRPVQGYYLAGNHESIMDVSSLGRGIYILSMVVDKTRIVRRLIIQ
jgi:hypothetical protein